VLVTRAADEETEDGRVRNAEASGKIRDTWIYKQIRLRQAEFTQFRQATVFLGTWNVNAKGKHEDALDGWLFADCNSRSGGGGATLPDIVAVAFQEIVDLNAVNVAVDNKTQQRSQFWSERILATLNQRDSYVLLSQRSMVGLLICVFTKAVHQRRVNHVSTASVGVGVMGMMGNKGGVSVRMQFYDSTLVFISSHLAAHRENVTGRNADFANVLSKTTFDVGEDAIREVIRSGSMSHWVIGSSSVGIPDHDVVFWLGDLNYRIDESMMTEKVLQLSEKGVLDELRTLDQLNVERAAGRVFEGFEEGPLHFRPTYKYQPGTHTYEQRPDKKLRAPAWCDRILWMAQEPQHVQQLSYNRSELPNCSDHKPVFSTMRLTVKDVIQPKREAIYEELMKLLDRFENQTLPMVGLDRVSLDYAEVRYNQSVTLPIRITNTGSVVAQFRLVPKLDEPRVCKPWMKVSPAYGMLIPGDEPAVMNFTLTIDKTTAQMLNTGREVLDDIVILRLENGRDYYITIKATYARSCFGMSADELVMYSDSIRSVPLDAVKRADMMDAKPTATALCVPKELWRLVDAIYEKGLGEPHLFVERGVPDEVSHIRECLDTGGRFGPFRIHSYTEALVTFLESLASPIVPSHVFPAVEIDSVNIQSSARRLLEELPPIHYNVFVYVISFFREVLLHQSRNLLSAAKVARVCCGCLAPGTGLDSSSASLQKRTGMQLIMLHLLETSSI
jgi:inositol polyphosphate 5-phosphatase INPP5B/F